MTLDMESGPGAENIKVEKIKMQGIRARRDGKSLRDNPHKIGSGEYLLWNSGYFLNEQEHPNSDLED